MRSCFSSHQVSVDLAPFALDFLPFRRHLYSLSFGRAPVRWLRSDRHLSTHAKRTNTLRSSVQRCSGCPHTGAAIRFVPRDDQTLIRDKHIRAQSGIYIHPSSKSLVPSNDHKMPHLQGSGQHGSARLPECVTKRGNEEKEMRPEIPNASREED
jgi:hypothetical protein